MADPHHNFFFWFLIWCEVGGFLWVVLDGCGVTARTVRDREWFSATWLVGATLLAIAAWPWVMWRILRNPKEAGAWLWKNLWGRP